MKITTQNLTGLQKYARNLNQHYILVFLCISLAIWICVPIIGIFPLLLSIQFNLLNNENPTKRMGLLNNLILILVVFTICVFFTSYTIYSDLLLYVQTYQQLENLNAFEATYSYGTGTEFIPFLIAYLVHQFTSGSVYAYLFVHALIINLLIVFVISKRLSRKYYPFILMIVFSTPFYYWQVPIMRHALSNTFLLMAIVFMESPFILFLSNLMLVFFSHNSNIINVGILFYLKISEFNLDNNLSVVKKNTKPKIIIFIAMFFMGFTSIAYVLFSGGISLSVVLPFFLMFSSLFGISNEAILKNRLVSYDNYGIAIGASIFDITIFVFMVITIIWFLLTRREISKKYLSLVIIFLFQIGSYFYCVVNLTNWRVYYLLISMTGIFYIPIIEEFDMTRNKLKKNLIFINIATILAYNIFTFFRGLTGGWIVAKEHVFFDGRPLQMTLFDYIQFFINATPNT
jgi:hypothetical protein